MCHLLMGHFPPNNDAERVMASLHPQNVFLHLMGHLSINLVVLVFVLLLDGEDFLLCEEDVFVPLFRHATGGDTLLLSVRLPSKQE